MDQGADDNQYLVAARRPLLRCRKLRGQMSYLHYALACSPQPLHALSNPQILRTCSILPVSSRALKAARWQLLCCQKYARGVCTTPRAV